MVSWWLLALLASTAEYSTGINERKSHEERDALKGQFPFTVFICYRLNSTHTEACGGTLATLNRIISSGYCFTDKQNVGKNVSKFSVVGGTLQPNATDEGKQERRVAKFKVHEGYIAKNDTTHSHDIAVAVVSIPFEESQTLSVMNVASLDEQENKQAWAKLVKSNRPPCTAVFWGAAAANRSEILKFVYVHIWDDAKCSQEGNTGKEQKPDIGVVCLSPATSSKESICKLLGDSGGPLICDGYVFGLTRSIEDCGTNKQQSFLLFWPYLKYFGLSVSKVNSTGSYDLTPSLICCLATILTTSML